MKIKLEEMIIGAIWSAGGAVMGLPVGLVISQFNNEISKYNPSYEFSKGDAYTAIIGTAIVGAATGLSLYLCFNEYLKRRHKEKK